MSKFNGKNKALKRIGMSTLVSFLFLFIGTILCKHFAQSAYDYTETVIISEAARINDSNVVKTELTITDTTTIDDIATHLDEQGIITDKHFFVLDAKLEKMTSGFIPGSYTISSNMPSIEILTLLTTSLDTEDTVNKFTIPEGYTIDQIAETLAMKGIVSKEEFIKAVTERNYSTQYPFLNEIPENANYKYKLEGYLFPDTYIVRKDVSAEEIVVKMLDRFDEIYASYSSMAHSTGYSTHELLTIASIIEQEARLEEERATIGGVIYNRLNGNMRLQMCSTVQYSLNKRKATLTYEDLQKESPYNTYLHNDLPIGPICNPGEACLKAAIFPEEHDYLFFVLKDSEAGTHAFSRTIAEHTAEKNLYQQSSDINFTN